MAVHLTLDVRELTKKKDYNIMTNLCFRVAYSYINIQNYDMSVSLKFNPILADVELEAII